MLLLHHTVTGSGPAVLLLHAGVCDSGMWDPQLDVLATDHTVVTPDFRGYGESPHLPGSYSDAGDVLVLLDHLGIEHVAVVGASFGGGVALQLASVVPQLVTRPVLLSAPADGVEPTADLRAFAEQEGALLEAGDLEAATELTVRTWVGPEASEATRQRVREMQERAFRVQLAAGEDFHSVELDVDLAVSVPPRSWWRAGGISTSSGSWRGISPPKSLTPDTSSWPGPATCRAWSVPARPPRSSARRSSPNRQGGANDHFARVGHDSRGQS